MYVEDNMSNIRLVEKVLARRPGISLIVAMEGRSAIRLAVEHLPDLILLDLHLPDVSGEDVLRELKGDPRTAGIPVVMLSADATPGRLKQLVKRDGAAGFLTKPLDIPGLFDVIDESTPAGNQPL
jgi:CheY-like chemotaxis protein